MKTLYLLRHAKASWDEDVEDHQRSLKKRGLSDADIVADEVVARLPMPEILVSSDAKRTLQTAEIFKAKWKVDDTDFRKESRLYDFQGSEVLKYIKELDDTVETAMLVGHNYAFTAIANMLGNARIDEIPTCGFVAIRFDVSHWKQVSKGETFFHVFPRHLKI